MMMVDQSRIVIADLPADDRPRERLARHGAAALSDTELIAILVGPGRPGRSSIDLAREALREGVARFCTKDWASGSSIPGIGPVASGRIGAALELGRRFNSARLNTSDPISDPESLAPALCSKYAHLPQERLCALYLDSRNRILREREIYIGTLTTASVSTRDVFRYALEDAAASIIVFHNHPSGDPAPSAEDVIFTKSLTKAAAIMGVILMDHLIIASAGYVSLRNSGFV
jgi:DNA repair protein RadC